MTCLQWQWPILCLPVMPALLVIKIFYVLLHKIQFQFKAFQDCWSLCQQESHAVCFFIITKFYSTDQQNVQKGFKHSFYASHQFGDCPKCFSHQIIQLCWSHWFWALLFQIPSWLDTRLWLIMAWQTTFTSHLLQHLLPTSPSTLSRLWISTFMGGGGRAGISVNPLTHNSLQVTRRAKHLLTSLLFEWQLTNVTPTPSW